MILNIQIFGHHIKNNISIGSSFGLLEIVCRITTTSPWKNQCQK